MKAVQVGLGPIGSTVCRLLLQKPGWQLVAAVDTNPAKQGCDVGEVLGLPQRLGITVCAQLPDLQGAGVDIAFVTTVSSFPDILPTLQRLVQQGINVVASSEELFFPYHRYPEEARALDELAKRHGVSVLGTGLNPGFIMDTLVLVLTSMCQHISRIAVTRVEDAAGRRPSLQRRIGVGLTPEAFADKAAQHEVGVIGLVDSTAFLAHALKWQMDDFKERLVPVIAEEPVTSALGPVARGHVRGVRHIVKGISHGKEAISLDLRLYIGAEEPRNTIYIEGTPTVEATIRSTDMGDLAAADLLVNMSPLVCQARPGLLTMLDLSIPRFFPQ